MGDGIGIIDAHLHIVDPRFPLLPSDGFVPKPFTCQDYLTMVRPLGVAGGVVVSGSFQAFDQTYLLDALVALGPSFVGVTALPAGCSELEIAALDRAGVRGVRFNLRRSGSAGPEDIDAVARKVFDVAGWHSEFYVRNADLDGLYPVLARLPRISIDHLGLCSDGFDVLLKLVDRGARVKATGFSRGDLDIPNVISRIHSVNPSALMFGTDLPSTRAPRPFSAADIDLVRETIGHDEAAKVLHDNAVALYRGVDTPCGGIDFRGN
jgi:predicted TIM-barrel fold metal-dependent hydrolase